MNKRWAVYGVLLAGSAWLAFFGNQEAEQVVAAAVPAPADGAATVPDAPSSGLLPLKPRDALFPPGDSLADEDPFATRDWTPTPTHPRPRPVVVPAPEPPPVPTPPPLPFSFAGKKREAGAWEVYLLDSDSTTVVAKAGDVIGDTYQVVRVQPPSLELIYLPLQQVQTLDIGSADR